MLGCVPRMSVCGLMFGSTAAPKDSVRGADFFLLGVEDCFFLLFLVGDGEEIVRAAAGGDTRAAGLRFLELGVGVGIAVLEATATGDTAADAASLFLFTRLERRGCSVAKPATTSAEGVGEGATAALAAAKAHSRLLLRAMVVANNNQQPTRPYLLINIDAPRRDNIRC